MVFFSVPLEYPVNPDKFLRLFLSLRKFIFLNSSLILFFFFIRVYKMQHDYSIVWSREGFIVEMRGGERERETG